jgi:glycosyltransferase involved in cell wall biosynthesis
MEKKKIVFLYTELATYFLASVKKIALHKDIEVHIIRWPLNKEAPFEFSFPENVKIYDRKHYKSDKALLDHIVSVNPSILYCSGWVDKGYLKVCKQYKNKIPVIVGFDNQWKGSFKQYLAAFISPFKILNHFSHCWVPGELQEEYALRLGFKKANILTGFYSCDFDFFYNQYLVNKQNKESLFPTRFIFVGRYFEFKGIKDLWNAFVELHNETPNEWELWCLGTGDIEPIVHPKIRHFGFVQPKDLPAFIKDTGVFILPSHFEPWGVVVHEFAAAGFPIICSDQVGARTTFVENNYNGYIYESGNIEALKRAMKEVINADSAKLLDLGEKSVEKAKQITPEIWAKQLISLIE